MRYDMVPEMVRLLLDVYPAAAACKALDLEDAGSELPEESLESADCTPLHFGVKYNASAGTLLQVLSAHTAAARDKCITDDTVRHPRMLFPLPPPRSPPTHARTRRIQ